MESGFIALTRFKPPETKPQLLTRTPNRSPEPARLPYPPCVVGDHRAYEPPTPVISHLRTSRRPPDKSLKPASTCCHVATHSKSKTTQQSRSKSDLYLAKASTVWAKPRAFGLHAHLLADHLKRKLHQDAFPVSIQLILAIAARQSTDDS